MAKLMTAMVRATLVVLIVADAQSSIAMRLSHLIHNDQVDVIIIDDPPSLQLAAISLIARDNLTVMSHDPLVPAQIKMPSMRIVYLELVAKSVLNGNVWHFGTWKVKPPA